MKLIAYGGFYKAVRRAMHVRLLCVWPMAMLVVGCLRWAGSGMRAKAN